jgi:hypothetical protein
MGRRRRVHCGGVNDLWVGLRIAEDDDEPEADDAEVERP